MLAGPPQPQTRRVRRSVLCVRQSLLVLVITTFGKRFSLARLGARRCGAPGRRGWLGAGSIGRAAREVSAVGNNPFQELTSPSSTCSGSWPSWGGGFAVSRKTLWEGCRDGDRGSPDDLEGRAGGFDRHRCSHDRSGGRRVRRWVLLVAQSRLAQSRPSRSARITDLQERAALGGA